MDKISLLPDALLLQILSFVPTKDAVATSVLSKRWQSLWKMVPKLRYDCLDHNNKYGTLGEFVYRSLLLHKAPVLESLHLRLDSSCAAVDIGIWVGIAADRCMRELDIELPSTQKPIRLPRSVYTCKTVVVLKLQNVILEDVPLLDSFMPLKALHLLSVKYPGDESVTRLLSSCPVLEDLFVTRRPRDNVITFTVNSNSLRSLYIDKSSKEFEGDDHGFVINAPNLKYLSVIDYWGGYCLIEKAPKMVEANVDVIYDQTEKLLGSLTSVKRLRLCLITSTAPYPIGSIFNGLIHLEICTCGAAWQNLVARMLDDCPKLQVLKLSQNHKPRARDPNVCWNQPSSIPECLLFHLETFEWRRYEGTQAEKDLVTYILTNASRLSVAAISLGSTKLEDQIRMLKELASVPRGSTVCRLFLD